MADISILGSVASAHDVNVSSLPVSYTMPTGSDREMYAIVAQGWFDAGDKVDSVKINGIDFTLVDTAPATNTIFRVLTVWRLLETSFPADGTYNVVADFGEAVAGVASIFVFTINNSDQATLEDKDIYSSGGSTTSSFTVDTLTANAAIFTATMHDGLGSYTHGSGQNEIFDTQVNRTTSITVTASYEIIASSGSNTQTDVYSGGSDKMCGVVWVVKNKVASGSSRKNKMTTLGVA